MLLGAPSPAPVLVAPTFHLAMAPFASTLDATADHHPSGALMTGIIVYAITMGLLTSWERHVLPKYMSPDHYKKMTGWTHPDLKLAPQPVSMLTADLPLGLPTLEEIQSACVRIGATDKTWDQYLCPTASYDSYDACEVSREFSDHYGVEIALCRRQRR